MEVIGIKFLLIVFFVNSISCAYQKNYERSNYNHTVYKFYNLNCIIIGIIQIALNIIYIYKNIELEKLFMIELIYATTYIVLSTYFLIDFRINYINKYFINK